MPKAVLLPAALALGLLATPGAEARIPTAKFEKIALGGLRLGMGFPQAEAMLRARRDWSEPGGQLGHNFDCDSLLPDRKQGRYDPYAGPRLPQDLHVEDAAHTAFALRFGATPGGAIMTRIGYRQ